MAENTIITLTSPEGATLNTAGTYCEGNIEVVPKLQSKVATTGEIVTADDGYVGLESVDTNPAFEAGKKSEYDAFWDNAQESGNRKNYSKFCSSVYYPSEILRKPKYPVVIVGNADRFMESFNTPYSTYGKSICASPLDGSSLSIDASGATSAVSFLANCSVENLFVDLSNATDLRDAFSNGNGIAQSDKIIIKVSEKCTLFGSFFNYQYLNNKTDVLRFAEGSVIAAGDLNLARTYQSKEGIISTVNALSSTTTGLSVTLRLSAINKAFETSEGANNGASSDEWLQLIATKPNWTINTIDS